MNQPATVLIVWNFVPCETTGAGIILRRLFQDYPQEKLWLLTSSVAARAAANHDPVPKPQFRREIWQAFFPHRYVDRAAELINALLTPFVAWRGKNLVRAIKAQVLFAVPWNASCVAAWLIHRWTRIPLHIYIMDDPAGAPAYPAWKAIPYRALMPRILRAASRVWCVSEPMAENIRKRYGVDAQPLLPLLDVQEFIAQSVKETERPTGKACIVYTGAIYDAQLDALQNLAAALNGAGFTQSDAADARLLLYTSVTEPMLRRMKLSGSRIHRAHVPIAEIPRVLAEADILFLPFSFDPRMRHVTETSLPTKLSEYLASGVPILVHAPPYATVARYCRDYECGVVVDEKDPEKLLAAVQQLLSDRSLRTKLSERARAVACENHDLRKGRIRFYESLAVR